MLAGSIGNYPIPEKILERWPLVIVCLASMEPGFSSTASKTEMQVSSSWLRYELIGLRLPGDHLPVTWQWIDMRFKAWISFKPKIGWQSGTTKKWHKLNFLPCLTVRWQVPNCLVEDLLQASKHTFFSIEQYKSHTEMCGKISLNIFYGNRLPDAPVSSLTGTVALFPTLLLTVTSVRRHWSFLSHETLSKVMFALWVYLTLVVKHMVVTFTALYSCTANGLPPFSSPCMSLCAFLPAPPWLCDQFYGLLLQNSLKWLGFLHLKHSFP